MMEDLEDQGSSQLDLFAWRGRDGGPGEGVGGNAPSGDARRPAPIEPSAVAAMTREALLGNLETRLESATGDSPTLRLLIAEVKRRREAKAAPLLARLCRRHAGFDRSRTVAEVAAALEALGALGAADAAPAILRLVEQGAFGPQSEAAAVRYLAVVRHRPAAALLRDRFEHESPEVRAAACGLAAATGTRGSIDHLQGLSADADAAVVDAAHMALGNLGYRPVKNRLEARLETATSEEIPDILEALGPVADEETAVRLGRVAERSPENAVRRLIADALAEVPGGKAVSRLLRLADDPCPGVRRAVVAALAERDDSRSTPALRHLADDSEAEVGEAAKVALRTLARDAQP